MKKFILIAAVAAALLGGCAEIRQIPGLDPSKPRVTVNLQNTGKPISVAPDPLVFLAGQTNVTIVWSLPKGSNLRFAENGIVIEGEITDRIVRSIQNDRAVDSIVIDRAQKEIVECRIANEGLDFTCLNRHTRPGLYKYTIRVLEGGKPLASLDPTVAND